MKFSSHQIEYLTNAGLKGYHIIELESSLESAAIWFEGEAKREDVRYQLQRLHDAILCLQRRMLRISKATESYDPACEALMILDLEADKNSEFVEGLDEVFENTLEGVRILEVVCNNSLFYVDSLPQTRSINYGPIYYVEFSLGRIIKRSKNDLEIVRIYYEALANYQFANTTNFSERVLNFSAESAIKKYQDSWKTCKKDSYNGSYQEHEDNLARRAEFLRGKYPE